MYDTEASRWQAVQQRDQAASTSFVYAVISTKIYCRPACPSRLARRANVHFYNTAADAAAAGYRPCLRCKPDQPALVGGSSQHGQRDAVRRACEYIQENEGQAKFADVAKRVGLSSRYLYGLFKAVVGTTPAKYAVRFKPGQAVQDQSETLSAVSEVTGVTEHDQSTGVVVDTVSWSTLVDLDFADFAAMHEDFSLQTYSDNFYDSISMIEATSDKRMVNTDIFDPRLPSALNVYMSSTDQQNSMTNLFHGLGDGHFATEENGLLVHMHSSLGDKIPY